MYGLLSFLHEYDVLYKYLLMDYNASKLYFYDFTTTKINGNYIFSNDDYNFYSAQKTPDNLKLINTVIL